MLIGTRKDKKEWVVILLPMPIIMGAIFGFLLGSIGAAILGAWFVLCFELYAVSCTFLVPIYADPMICALIYALIGHRKEEKLMRILTAILGVVVSGTLGAIVGAIFWGISGAAVPPLRDPFLLVPMGALLSAISWCTFAEKDLFDRLK